MRSERSFFVPDSAQSGERQIRQICAAFQQAWRAGRRPDLTETLAAAERAVRKTLLVELIALEVALRRQVGETVTRQEYEERFADAAEQVALAFARFESPGSPGTVTAFAEADREGTTQRDAALQEAPTMLSPAPAAGGGAITAAFDVPTVAAPSSAGAPAVPNEEILGGRVFGDYELLEEIACGGMGVVYKARQRKLNRVVALKMILAGQFARARDVQRFYCEAKAAAQLDHPGIVPIYEIGEYEGQHFFSMAYVPGASLAAKVKDGPVPEQEAAELVRKIAQAVQYAHERGIIHRDLKPHNVLLDEHGEPKVTDFGLAKRVESDSGLTATGAVMGTPSYMPPEQAAGKREVGPAADIYALGAILYHLLTGRPPFQAAHPLDTILQVLQGEPIPPRQLNPAISRDLETICLKCLEKAPEKRYATADALAQELSRYLRGEPIQARPVSRLERGWRWCRRNRAVASLAAAVVLALVTGAVISTYMAIAARRAESLANLKTAEALQEKKRADQKTEEALQEKARADQNAQEATDEAATAKREWKRAEDALLRAEWLLYASYISSAQREWEYGDARSAWIQLEASRRDFRGWEYKYLHTLFNSNQRTFQEANLVFCVAFSPDGSRIVIGSADNTLKVWDVSTGQQMLSLKGHTLLVSSAAFSPDGDRIVSGSWDNTLKVWDASTGQELFTLKGHTSRVTTAAFSPDGSRIASGSDDSTLKLWDALTGQELLTLKGHTDRVTSVALSADGARIASASWDKTLRVWDASTGQETLTLKGHTGGVVSVAFSPDDSLIVSGSDDKTLRLWDALTGQEVLTLKGHTERVYSVAFSPDGGQIVSGSGDATVKIWDTSMGQEASTLKGHIGGVASVAFSPNGSQIASGSFDETVKIWNATAGQDPPTLKAAGGGACVAFSPDSARIVSESGVGELKVWDATTRQETLTLKGHQDKVTSVAFSPDGLRIVSGSNDETLKVWDSSTGQELFTLKGHAERVNSVAFSPDGARIVSGSGDATLKVWSASTGQELLTLKGHTDNVTSVAFSPDGSRIVSGSWDNTLKVWDATTGQEIFTLKGHTGGVTSVAFSPDGARIVSGSDDKTLKVWGAAVGQEMLTLKGHTDNVTSVAFSPDGARVVSCSVDGMLRVWDGSMIQKTPTLKGHGERVYSIALAPRLLPRQRR